MHFDVTLATERTRWTTLKPWAWGGTAKRSVRRTNQIHDCSARQAVLRWLFVPNEMDLSAIIRELHARKQAVERAIADLELLARAESAGAAIVTPEQQHVPRRRGRKSMGEAERREVSERMTAYWAAKRNGRAAAAAFPTTQADSTSVTGSGAAN